MRLLELCVLAAINSYLLEVATSRDNNTQYFINAPSNSTHTISEGSEDAFAIFECSTRAGDAPLWIVNAVSVNIIRNTSGYASIHYELYGLQEHGHIISYLFIPVSAHTNNSVVVCAAIGNGEPLAFSAPVYLLVINNKTSPSTASTSTTSSFITTKFSGPETNKVLSIQWIAGMTVMACLVMGLFIVIIFTGIIMILQRRQKMRQRRELHPSVVENIYWSKETAIIPPVEDNSTDLTKT